MVYRDSLHNASTYIYFLSDREVLKRFVEYQARKEELDASGYHECGVSEFGRHTFRAFEWGRNFSAIGFMWSPNKWTYEYFLVKSSIDVTFLQNLGRLEIFVDEERPVTLKQYTYEPVYWLLPDGRQTKAWPIISEYANDSLTAVGGYQYYFLSGAPVGYASTLEEAKKKLIEHINNRFNESK